MWGATIPALGWEVALKWPTAFLLGGSIVSFVLGDVVTGAYFQLDNDGRTGFYRGGEMISDFYIKEGDTKPAFAGFCVGEDGARPNLTSAAVLLKIRNRDTGAVALSAAMTVVDGANASVSYAWQTADTAAAYEGQAEVEVTFQDGSVETFPNNSTINVHITKDVS